MKPINFEIYRLGRKIDKYWIYYKVVQKFKSPFSSVYTLQFTYTLYIAPCLVRAPAGDEK